jgi:glycosyltransferase involved in cell wall biosynthesis
MKVVVYLPALNEAETIAGVLDGIPRRIPGVEAIETLVVDDGSTDGTAAIAVQHGARVVRHDRNLGTGRTFVSGITAALEAGADIIVSMDADGQFRGADIATLIQPILDGDADVALCTRFSRHTLIGQMALLKRFGNHLLTRIISAIAGIPFTDVSCGFRAVSRKAALQVDIHSDFEYIHESLLNWTSQGLRIQEVSLSVLAERPAGTSRIMRSVVRYAYRYTPALMRALADHRRPKKGLGAGG